MIDAVVTHHTDGFRSGVARFNELLAEHLGVPRLTIEEAERASAPLLSFKVSELPEDIHHAVRAATDRGRTWDVFLHEYAGSDLERRIVEGARRVHAGNAEIAAQLGLTESLWTPGLLGDDRRLPDVAVSVFSFGMAHKIRVDMFERLRALLEASGRSYAVFVSAANHETASMRDAEDVFAEMHEIFPQRLYFLGNLSDVAVADWLRRSTYFAAFFRPAVRANNTSVASAMERGAVVITNLDEYSPGEYVHGETLLDVEQCEALPSEVSAIRGAARSVAAARGWTELTARLGGTVAG